MQVRRIYLVGPRASGKSTVGRALAQSLGWRFADTDELVVRGAGCSVADIVSRGGWEAFRNMESAALRAVSGEDAMVIATGGGMVLRQENRECMARTGWVVLLMAEPQVLAARLCADPQCEQRPSLTCRGVAEEVAAVLAEREPLYRAVARHVAQAEWPVQEIVQDVLQALELRSDT